MRASRSTLLIGAMAVVIAVLAVALVYFARDELGLTAERPEEEIATPSAVGEAGGFATVSVSAESQKASGIATAALEAARSSAAAEVYGVVVNLQPLFELRGRYLAALAERRALRAAAGNGRAEYERLKQLYADDRNVSERVVQAAEAQWKADEARVQGAEQSAESIRDEIRAAWGPTITEWTIDPEEPRFASLAAQRAVIVQIAFPHDLQSHAGRTSLSITPIASRAAQLTARYLSPAPQTDASLPGATYFYLVEGQALRTGMRVAGQLQLGGKTREGVALPEAAVVWHGGRAWAYVREEPTTFMRRPVSTAEEIGNAWFNAEGFEPGEQVVVSGAQLLLSEELKFQIRNENED
jgi:hypothetical protein